MGKSELTYPCLLLFQFLVTGIWEKFELHEGSLACFLVGLEHGQLWEEHEVFRMPAA